MVSTRRARASLAASLAVAALGVTASSYPASHASSRVVPGARAASAGAPVVQTECGPVLGTFNSTFSVAAFRGIPYAVPPLGDLRFAPPVSARAGGQCWGPATYNASEFGPYCVQSGQFLVAGQEDCLFLNVWTPWANGAPLGVAAGPLPVMVFSYGGDLTDGKSNFVDFSLVSSFGPMVMVSMNYRVNFFGFLALQELSATSATGTSGNFGFQDQILSLQWVQDNIAAFGGDPTRVTFFGQSSGGTSAFALLASPLAKGLFSRVLSLSGSANLTMDRVTAEANNAPYVAEMGCGGLPSAAATVACLRHNVSVEQIVHTVPESWDTSKFLWQYPPASAATSPQGMGYQGIAIVDGYVVTMPLREALQTGLVDVPLAIAYLAQETDANPGQNVLNATQAQFAAQVGAAFSPWGADAPGRLLDAYAPEMSVGGPQMVFDTMLADYGMTCGSTVLGLDAFRGFRSPVYVYVVSARPSHPIWGFASGYEPRFAWHSWDIVAGFGDFDLWSRPFNLPPFTAQASDAALGLALRRAWYNFTRDGALDPASGWQPINGLGCATPSLDCYTIINVTANGVAVPTRNLKRDVCNLWAELGFDERFWWSN